MDNGNQPKWFDDRRNEDRFADGFIDGFVRARVIFWRDFMRKAGELRLMIDQMKDSLGETAENSPAIEAIAAMEATYRNAADLVSRSHNLYPGALPNEIDPEDPRFTVRFDDLFRY